MESDIFLWLFLLALFGLHTESVFNKSQWWHLTNVAQRHWRPTHVHRRSLYLTINSLTVSASTPEISHKIECMFDYSTFSWVPVKEMTLHSKIVFNDNERRIFMEAPSVQEQTLKCCLHGGHSVPLHSRRCITVGSHKYSSALICSLAASTSTLLLLS